MKQKKALKRNAGQLKGHPLAHLSTLLENLFFPPSFLPARYQTSFSFLRFAACFVSPGSLVSQRPFCHPPMTAFVLALLALRNGAVWLDAPSLRPFVPCSGKWETRSSGFLQAHTYIKKSAYWKLWNGSFCHCSTSKKRHGCKKRVKEKIFLWSFLEMKSESAIFLYQIIIQVVWICTCSAPWRMPYRVSEF